MNKTRVLYIEDEPYLSRIVKETLVLKGFDVLHRSDGGGILELINEFRPQLCILDVMLPHIDGFTLGGLIRNLHPQLPIIFLTARTQTQDVVAGFSAGGTDYLKKPFSMEELIVRMENQLRISSKTEEPGAGEAITLGNSRYFPLMYELHSGGNTIKLSHREAQVLTALTRYINQPLDRRQLLQMVWGSDSFFNSRTLDVYIRKLRDYFSQDSSVEIITLKGVGYFFSLK